MTDQITPEEFDRMSDDQITRARRLGQLDGITGVRTQLSHADLAAMSAEQITEAHARGACANLTGARIPKVNPGQGGTAPHGTLPLVQADREALKAMSAEEIVEANRRGEFSNLLGSAPKPSISPRP